MAERVLPVAIAALGKSFVAEVSDCMSQIGSGALPVETIPSVALKISSKAGEDAKVRRLAEQLRQLQLPVVGRLHKGALWLDLRCLEREEELVEQLQRLSI